MSLDGNGRAVSLFLVRRNAGACTLIDLGDRLVLELV